MRGLPLFLLLAALPACGDVTTTSDTGVTDADPLIHPDATEVCDGVDNDCDGLSDTDRDADDCDDGDASVHPGAFDWLNDGADNNCDGDTDGPMVLSADFPAITGTDAAYGEYMGLGVAVCDLDGDGLDDLITSAPFGGTTASGVTLENETIDDVYMGWSGEVVDADGDGALDLILGLIGDPSGALSYPGNLMVFSDITNSASSISEPLLDHDGFIAGTTDGGQLAIRVRAAGDFTGDGVSDLWVNEYYGGSSNQGRLWLLDSSAIMTETELEDASLLVLEGDEALNGDSTAASFPGGDFDGDGFSDLVVTQSAYADPSTGELLGRVFVVMAPGS